MKKSINNFGRMLGAFMLCAGLLMTSCEGEEPIDDNKTEQGGNENNGDEDNGSGDTTGGENGGGEGEPQGPVTINLSKVTATTATFTGHLNIPASDLPFSKVSVFYSSSETFNVNNARYKSTTKFDDEQNFTISITELDCNTQYNYCVVTEIKSEKSYGDIKNFTTTEVCVSLTPKESNIISGSPIAEFDIVVTGLTEDDNNYVGILFSSSEEELHYSRLNIYPAINSEGTYSIKTNILEIDSKYYYCYYIADRFNTAYIYGETKEIITTHPYSISNDLDISSATNLSSSASANSYMVSEAGLYKIKAVKGNSRTPVGNAVSASILWECDGTNEAPEFNELISGVCYKDGYLYFQVAEPFKEGNALIAVKDPDNKILWSWHIWLTDTPQSHTYDNEGKIVMMDRNLGATSALPGEPCYGMLYQWGRKDPFPGASLGFHITPSGGSYGLSSTTTFSSPVKVLSYDSGTIDFATANPMTLLINYYDDSWYTKTWYYDWEMMPMLWQASKTIYDPCPTGWKVPSDKECWSGFIDKDNISLVDEGMYININSPSTTFYPHIVTYDEFGEFGVNFYGLGYDSASGYWTANMFFENPTIYVTEIRIQELGFSHKKAAIFNHGRTHSALPVRCIKE